MTWKIAGSVLALIPLGFFLLFALGEGGSGWPHYLQMGVVVAFVALGWRFPIAAAYGFLMLGVAGGAFYAFANNFPLPTIALVELVVFLPLVLSGACFLKAQR